MALILPAHPPQEPGHKGEVEELVDAGFAIRNIICVERDEAIADELYRFYYDQLQVHYEELDDFLDKCVSKFSYVHLDFCAQLNENQLRTIQSLRSKLSPVAHVRISTAITRRSANDIAFENSIRHKVLLPMLDAIAAIESSPRWDRIRDAFTDSKDSTHITGIALLFDHFFGQDLWSYADLATLDTPFIPKVTGRSLLTNVSRFSYREPLGHTSMYSLWMDTAPLVVETIPSEEWLINYLHMYFESLAHPIYIFQED